MNKVYNYEHKSQVDVIKKSVPSSADRTYENNSRRKSANKYGISKYDEDFVFRKTDHLSERKREIDLYRSIEEKKNRKNRWLKYKLFCRNLFRSGLWDNAFKNIEGHQGTGVLSFFVLLRWLLFLNIALAIISFFVINMPLIILSEDKYTNNLTQTCTSNYQVNISTDAGQLLLDFFLGSGWMEKTELFYGFYPGTSLSSSSGAYYNFPLAYLLVVIVSLLLSVFLMARYSVTAFRKYALTTESTSFAYFILIFCNWDYSMTSVQSSLVKERKLRNVIKTDLEEQRFLRERQKKLENNRYKCALYTFRLLVHLFVLICLTAAGYAIYRASEFSTKWIKVNSENVTGLQIFISFLVELLPSLAISFLNAVLPLIFNLISHFEKYTQDFTIKLTLVRTVCLKLSSLVILIVPIYTEVIACLPKDECEATSQPCPSVSCWETHVGQELYKLMIVDFAVILLKVFLVETPRRIVTIKCPSKLCRMIGPATFDVSMNVLDLVYGQAICWISLYFVPLMPAIYIIRLVIIFYVKMLSALVICDPPSRPYKAARSNSFFMVVLILTFFLSCFPVIYAISNITTSKGCGVFREYDFAYSVINISVQQSNSTGLIGVFNTLTSPAVAASLIVVLLVLLYCCSKLRRANKDRVKYLREKLLVENQDRQYLLNQLKQTKSRKDKDHKVKDIDIVGV